MPCARERAAGRSGSRKAILGSIAFHAALLLTLFRMAAIAEPDAPGLAEVRAAVEETTPLQDLPPVPPPPSPPDPAEAPPPSVFDTPPPEEAPEVIPDAPPMRPLERTIALYAPGGRSVAARIRPKKPVPVPPAPVLLPVPVAAPRPSGPTADAKPAPGNRSPRYPPRAVTREWEGVVLLVVSVRADGSVADVSVRRGSGRPILDREAIRAVLRWSFTPALEDGVPVAALVEVPIRFELR